MKRERINRIVLFFSPLKKEKYLFLLIAIINILVAFFYLEQPFLFYKDTQSYFDAVEFLRGHPIESATFATIFFLGNYALYTNKK